MDKRIIRHLESIRPSIDVLGEWLVTCNAKTAQKGMMQTALHHRQITHRRGLRNYQRVWSQVVLPRIDDIFMFTFVRNPWDRALSAFCFLQQYRGRFKGLRFRDFVKTELKTQGVKVDEHFRPQAQTFLCDGKPIPGLFVGRFERLQEDWEFVANKLGVQKKLPHFNKTRHKHYPECYDRESRRIVGKLYELEILSLGYTFGD